MLFLRRVFLPVLIFAFTSSAYAYQQIELVREVGEAGKKASQRQLNAAQAVAVAGEKIFIADTEAHRVVVLDATGKLVQSWGTKGDKPGQFRAPAGIAVDEQGRVYVADTGNHRIQVFSNDGKLIRKFGSKGNGSREFNSPSGISVQSGLLFVADTKNSRVQVVSYDGIYITQIALKTEKDEMKEPVAVCVDAQNRIYVLDMDTNKVRIFDQAGALLNSFGSKGKGADGFSSPRGLAVDQFGSVYVADTGNYKLKKFDLQGKLVASVGTEGNAPGQFRESSGIAIDQDGKVYVLDSDKNTLQIFSPETGAGPALTQSSPPPTVEVHKEFAGITGELSGIAAEKQVLALVGDSLRVLSAQGRSIGLGRGGAPSFLKNPQGMTIDSAGNYWVADTGNDRLQKFSPEGKLLQVIGKYGSGEGEFRNPSGVAIGAKGNIYVADSGNRRIQVFSAKGMFLGAFGKSGKSSSQFSNPVALAVNGSDFVYVADRENNRIAKFDSNGSLIWEAGKTGEADGEFTEPCGIAVSQDGEVYVLDAGNNRIQVFSTSGKFLRKFGSPGKEPGQFKSPQALALEENLHLYVADRGNNRIQVFTLHQTPAVPKDVAIQARANEVQLNWKGNTESFLDQYKIYRGESATGPFKLAGTAKDPFFVDSGLTSNKAYYYQVSSQAKEGNESTRSSAISASTPKLVPGTPRKVRIEAAEKQITLSWLPNPEPFVSYYRIYRSKQPTTGFEVVRKDEKTVYVDGALENETLYYYEIAAVGKEGDESAHSEVVFVYTPKAALTVPPIEIGKIEISEIFSAAYKYYESHAVGKVVIANNSDHSYNKVKLSFRIKDYMDYATEVETEELAPGKSAEIQLKPVFSNKILEVTENTPLQSELALTYYMAGEAKTITRSFPVMLYQRNAIRWDQKQKVGTFITDKDPVVTDFVRSVIQPYVDTFGNLPQQVVYARALYDALGVLGFSYLLDPTPFQEFSENSAIVDYTAYPREVLQRKSGDCDALSMLFAASLQNIGIGTALIDVPGHVFMMFNTGVVEKDRMSLGFENELLIAHRGTMWIPLEMTMVGSSFTRAWQKGAEEYRDWSAKKKAEIIDVEKSWEQFKPVTLPSADFKAPKVTRDEIEAKYKNELETLGRQRLAVLSASYLDELKKKPNNTDALVQLGILYGENSLYAEALEQFQKVLAEDANNATAHNNVGNIYYLQERLEDAHTAYQAAYKDSPADTGVMVNLSRVLLRMGKKDASKKLFQEALAVDPRVVRQYPDVAVAVGIMK